MVYKNHASFLSPSISIKYFFPGRARTKMRTPKMHLVAATSGAVYKMNFPLYTTHDIPETKMTFIFQAFKVPAALSSFFYCLFMNF